MMGVHKMHRSFLSYARSGEKTARYKREVTANLAPDGPEMCLRGEISQFFTQKDQYLGEHKAIARCLVAFFSSDLLLCANYNDNFSRINVPDSRLRRRQ